MSPWLDGLAYAFLTFTGLIMLFAGVIPEKYHSQPHSYVAYAVAFGCGYLTYKLTIKSIALGLFRSGIGLLWLVNLGLVLMKVF